MLRDVFLPQGVHDFLARQALGDHDSPAFASPAPLGGRCLDLVVLGTGVIVARLRAQALALEKRPLARIMDKPFAAPAEQGALEQLDFVGQRLEHFALRVQLFLLNGNHRVTLGKLRVAFRKLRLLLLNERDQFVAGKIVHEAARSTRGKASTHYDDISSRSCNPTSGLYAIDGEHALTRA